MGRRGWLGLTWTLALVTSACGPASTSMPDGGAEPGAPCIDDTACDDGIFCNGRERCRPTADGDRCFAGAPACGTGACDETIGCIGCDVTDADGDGRDAIDCGGDDCDDTDPARRPGAREVCDPDGVDEDCDPRTYGVLDADGDGATTSACCNGEACGPDCDDDDSAIRPATFERCDGVDDDCDGVIDDGTSLCVLPGAGSSACTEGRCVATACAEGFDDCDGDPSDGCEVDLTSNDAHCGGCGTTCGWPLVCERAACRPATCDAGFHQCGDACFPDDSIVTCGGRCDPCPSVPNATTWCRDGGCGFECNGETDLVVDALGTRCVRLTPPPERRVVLTTATSVTHVASGVVRVDSPDVTITVTFDDPLGHARIGDITRSSGEPFPTLHLTEGPTVVSIEMIDALPSTFELTLVFGDEPTLLHFRGIEPTGIGSLEAAVATSGDVVVVGAPFDDSDASTVDGDRANTRMRDAGAAYVLERDADGAWQTTAYLKPPDPAVAAMFGTSVAVDGDTIVVGALGARSSDGLRSVGAAYRFRRAPTGDRWIYVDRLLPPVADEGDQFGRAVAIVGSLVAVGAPYEDGPGVGHTGDPEDDLLHSNTGAVFVFDDGAYVAYLKAEELTSEFGGTVTWSERALVVRSRRGAHVFRDAGLGLRHEITLPTNRDPDGARGAPSVCTHDGMRYQQWTRSTAGDWTVRTWGTPSSGIAAACDSDRVVVASAMSIDVLDPRTEPWTLARRVSTGVDGVYPLDVDAAGSTVVVYALGADSVAFTRRIAIYDIEVP